MTGKTIRIMVAGVGIVTPLILGIPSAAASNPNYFSTPAAGPAGGTPASESGEVCTYKAPPAEGGAAPGRTAAGGSPGFELNECRSVGNSD